MNNLLQLIFSIVLLTILFFISQISIRQLFRLFHAFVKSNNIVYILISVLLLPGTIIHELSHAFMAMILQLRIVDIHIFPKWKHGQIKLGSVLYEKKDVFRSILVGVAPFFFGFIILWWLYGIGMYQSTSIIQHIGISYIVFVISTTMFSSKQDIVDIIYMIPVVIIIIGIVYIFRIDMEVLSRLIELEGVANFLYSIRTYLTITIGIHIAIIIFSTSILALHTKL